MQFSWLFCSPPYRIPSKTVDMKRTDMIYILCSYSLSFLQVTRRNTTFQCITELQLARYRTDSLYIAFILSNSEKKWESPLLKQITIEFLFFLPHILAPWLILKMLLFTNELSNSPLTLTKNQGNYVPQFTNRGRIYYLILNFTALLALPSCQARPYKFFDYVTFLRRLAKNYRQLYYTFWQDTHRLDVTFFIVAILNINAFQRLVPKFRECITI
jgi:hypothetical protein